MTALPTHLTTSMTSVIVRVFLGCFNGLVLV
jgi:hypothetical protein